MKFELRSRLLILTGSCLAITFATASARAAPGDIYNLGVLNGGSASYATSINESGQVAGWGWWASATQGIDKHAFRYDWLSPGVGTMLDLGTLGARNSQAASISNAGSVTGYSDSFSAEPGPNAFLYSGPAGGGGTMQDLGTYGAHSSFGTGLSPDGKWIVGELDLANAVKGFIAQLPSNGGGYQWPPMLPFAVNNSGQVTGIGPSGAARFDTDANGGGVLHSLGTLGGALASGRAINSSGQVVGESDTADGTRHAFRYDGTPGQGGTMHDLGTVADQPYSFATDINDAGYAVGYGTQPLQTTGMVAALWKPDGSVIDLNAWLDSVNPEMGARWTLTEARAINNSGLIVGNGRYSDGSGNDYYFPAFVLDASSLMPEPSTISLVLLGAALFSNSNVVRRRARLALRQCVIYENCV